MTSEQRALLVPDGSASSQRIPVLNWETKGCTDLNGHSLPTAEKDGSSGDKGDAKDSSLKQAEGFAFFRLPARKKWTFLLLAFSNFAASACFSLLAPFFPAEAAKKSMPPAVIGLIFSCFEGCIFLASPVIGKFMPQIGPRFAFIAGQFMAGSCSILFGITYLCPPGATFIVLCFILRTITALGASAFITASFTIIANEFPQSVATVFGVLETFTGLGYVVGPLLGGFLYEVGGFGLPFYVMGMVLLVCTTTTYFLMPARNEAGPQKAKQSILRLLRSPLVVLSCFASAFGCYTFGFFDASLALHLEQFELSALVTGTLFMMVAVNYSLFSPLFGWLSDRKNVVFPLLIAGNMLVCLSLLLIGPSPLLPFLHTELWLIIVSLILLGPGVCASVIPGLKCLYTGARRLGFEDGLELDGLVSGMLNSSIHFGTFLGPTIGNAVLQSAGYEWSATLNAGFSLLVAVSLSIYVIVERTCLKYDDYKRVRVNTEETAHLLHSSDSRNHSLDQPDSLQETQDDV